MIIEISQQFLNDLPKYVILGIGIMFGFFGIIFISIRDNLTGLVFMILCLIFIMSSLIFFDILQIHIIKDVNLSNSTGVYN